MIGHQWWWLIINNINWRLYWDPTRRTFTNIQITFRQNKIHANCHSSLINRYETPYLCWNPVPVCRPKIVGYRLALPNFLFLAASQSIPPPRFRRNWSRYLCVLAHWHPTEFSVLQLNVHIYIQNVFCCMLIIIIEFELTFMSILDDNFAVRSFAFCIGHLLQPHTIGFSARWRNKYIWVRLLFMFEPILLAGGRTTLVNIAFHAQSVAWKRNKYIFIVKMEMEIFYEIAIVYWHVKQNLHEKSIRNGYNHDPYAAMSFNNCTE